MPLNRLRSAEPLSSRRSEDGINVSESGHRPPLRRSKSDGNLASARREQSAGQRPPLLPLPPAVISRVESLRPRTPLRQTPAAMAPGAASVGREDDTVRHPAEPADAAAPTWSEQVLSNLRAAGQTVYALPHQAIALAQQRLHSFADELGREQPPAHLHNLPYNYSPVGKLAHGVTNLTAGFCLLNYSLNLLEVRPNAATMAGLALSSVSTAVAIYCGVAQVAVGLGETLHQFGQWAHENPPARHALGAAGEVLAFYGIHRWAADALHWTRYVPGEGNLPRPHAD